MDRPFDVSAIACYLNGLKIVQIFSVRQQSFDALIKYVIYDTPKVVFGCKFNKFMSELLYNGIFFVNNLVLL